MRLASESLERRIFLDGDVSLTSKGTLIVNGTAGLDTIEVSTLANDMLRVLINSSSFDVALAGVKRLQFNGGDGGDLIDNQTGLRSTLNGDAGGDTMIGGSGPDSLNGGDGSDLAEYFESTHGIRFYGESAESSIAMVQVGDVRIPENDEELIESGAFIDNVIDADLISISTEMIGGTSFTDAFLAREFSRLRTYFGRGRSDVFQSSTNLEQVAHGDAGDDTFIQNDETFPLSVFGGSGHDFVTGTNVSLAVLENMGGGSDTLDNSHFSSSTSQPPPDFIDLSVGTPEVLWGASGAAVYGNDKSNFIHAGRPGEFDGIFPMTVFGGAGDDTMIGSDATDLLRGGAGNDSIEGGLGGDTIRGGDGNDTLIGGAGRDKLYGDAGDDLLLGRGGSKDRLDGGDGDDTATADSGPDVFDLIFNLAHVN